MADIEKEAEGESVSMPQRKSKVISLSEAGKMIANCETISMADTSITGGPMALIREAIRAGAKNLTVIPSTASGMPTDLLIAAGCVKTLYVSFIGFEFLGFAPAFKKAGETKSINIIEADELFIVEGARAAACNMPFIPIRKTYEATSLPKLNPLIKTVKDPYTGEEVMTIPPLKADVAIIHAQWSDERGNVQCWGGNRQEWDRAMGAKFTIVSTEQIVSVNKIRENPDKTTLPGHMVNAVVHVPYGAHPTASHGFYTFDEEHLRLYLSLVAGGKADEYLSRFVFEPQDHYEYMQRVGLKHLLHLPNTW